MPGNFAFIDSQNVNLGIRELGWRLDFKRFRVYLKEKYDVERAYIFIGYMPENQKLYTRLQEFGYILIHKPILRYKDGTVKGNCDAELVLQAMIVPNSKKYSALLKRAAREKLVTMDNLKHKLEHKKSTA
ncbi:MAG: NYN domain-containing protein [bacterium]|nr:NYN domain-containing protein [bacterium]